MPCVVPIRGFLAQVVATEGLRLAWGECLEHAGAGEAYLPVLAALGRLYRGMWGVWDL